MSQHNVGVRFAQAATQKPPGFASELWFFLATNKKWWLAPIVIATVVLGALVSLGSSAAAPFIYTLF